MRSGRRDAVSAASCGRASPPTAEVLSGAFDRVMVALLEFFLMIRSPFPNGLGRGAFGLLRADRNPGALRPDFLWAGSSDERGFCNRVDAEFSSL